MTNKSVRGITEERKQQIVREISIGSVPGFRFYALLSTASLIAAFGLIANSTAVIIGAMLVSPLMTPIIGITLGLVIGKPKLLGTSLRSVILGVVLAIIFAGLIGFLPLELSATPEMLSRTKPTILDLIVAVLAGFAGAYAMIDEKLSPALPGVAIATAIVPPLSNAGICLSLGYYYGAFGSFMLFFANFLSILLVAGATFVVAGLSPWWISISSKGLIKRFGLAIIGFIAVCVFLTYSLIGIVKERYLSNSIKNTLEVAMNELHATSLDSFIYDLEDGKLYVLANSKSPRPITPFQVQAVQKKIEERTNRSTELIIRNVLAQDVGAPGSSENVVRQNLDGSFVKENLQEWKRAVNVVEKELLEMLALWAGMSLVDVDYIQLLRGPTVIATIKGYRNLTRSEVDELQTKLRKTINNDNMNIIIRYEDVTFIDANGSILPGYIYSFTEEQKIVKDEIENDILKTFKKYKPIKFHHRPTADTWDILVETIGITSPSAKEIHIQEREMYEKYKLKMHLALWHRSDPVITSNGLISFDEHNKKNVEELDKYLKGRQ
jgi:uncharacterized hydrophobic protein (TIGR00271 family)